MEKKYRGKKFTSAIGDLLVFGFFVLSTVYLLAFKGQTAYKYVTILLALVTVLYSAFSRKVIYLKSVLIPLIFAEVFVGAFNAAHYKLPDAYVYAAIMSPILLVPFFFMVTYVADRLNESCTVLDVIVLGLKVTCVLQLLWIPLQFVLYKFCGIDIGDIVFNGIFHSNVSTLFIREDVYHPSGLGWHSGLIAPMFVIAMLVFRNPLILLIIFAESLMVGSSTSVAGALGCLGLLILFSLIHFRETKEKVGQFVKKTPVPVRILLAVLVVAAIAAAWKFGILASGWASVQNLFHRVLHPSTDGSSNAHFGYFRQYFEVIRNSSLMQVLFGYGNDCSGYPFQTLYGEYWWLSSYAIECDYVNIALNRGIIGFVLYYAMMGYIAVKGARTDHRYLIFILCMLVQGIGYNVQWDYVFAFELVLFASLKQGKNFFEFGRRAEEDSLFQRNPFMRALLRL